MRLRSFTSRCLRLSKLDLLSGTASKYVLGLPWLNSYRQSWGRMPREDQAYDALSAYRCA